MRGSDAIVAVASISATTLGCGATTAARTAPVPVPAQAAPAASKLVSLGLMYESGRGVARDEARASALYKQACDAGDAHGCGNLGFMVETGKGVDRDEARAGALYQQACDAGDDHACTNRDRLRSVQPVGESR